MGTTSEIIDPVLGEKQELTVGRDGPIISRIPTWRRFFGGPKPEPSDGHGEVKSRLEKWSLGVLNDRETEEVPGT